MNFCYSTRLFLVVFTIGLLYSAVFSVAPKRRKSYGSDLWSRFTQRNSHQTNEPPIEEDKSSSDDGTFPKDSKAESANPLAFINRFVRNQAKKLGTARGAQSDADGSQNGSNGAQNETTNLFSEMEGTSTAGSSRRASSAGGDTSPRFETSQGDFPSFTRRDSGRRAQRTRSGSSPQLFSESPKKKVRGGGGAAEQQGGYVTDSEGGTRERSGSANLRWGGEGTAQHQLPPRNDAKASQQTAAATKNTADQIKGDAEKQQQQGTRDRDESSVELVTNAIKSSGEAFFYSAKLMERTTGTTVKWLNQNVKKPDMEILGELAKKAASTLGDAASVGKDVTVTTAKFLWPPAKRYVWPIVKVSAWHAVPIARELTKSAYEGAVWLKPRVGGVVKPAWRKSSKFVRKKMRPTYNNWILPMIKEGTKKAAEMVSEWQEWPESNSESENDGKASGSAGAGGGHGAGTLRKTDGAGAKMAPTEMADKKEKDKNGAKGKGKAANPSEDAFDQLQSDSDW